MTWQGQQGAGGTGDPDEEEATRADWPVPAAPPDAAAPEQSEAQPAVPPSPFAPGGPLAGDAQPVGAPPPSAAPPGPPSAPPVAAPPSGAPAAPWAPVDPNAGSWGTPPTGGGQFAVPGAPGLVYAGAIPRAAAWLVDSFLLGILVSIVTVPFAASAFIGFDPSGDTVPDLTQLSARTGIAAAIGVAIEAVYFIALWMSGGRATIGMRLFNLQVGNFADGTKLRTDQAAKRWIAYGSWAGLAGLVPVLGGLVGLLQLAWTLLLLVTTASSPTKQGLHDRFAQTAVVRPASAGNGLAITCLVVFLALPILLLFLIVPLIFLGSQVSDILSAVGESV